MLDAIVQAAQNSLLLVIYVAMCLGAAAWFVVTSMFGGGDEGALDDVDGDGGVLSLRSVLLFCMGFGGLGAIAVSLGASLWISLVAGAFGGLVIAAVGIGFFRVLRRQEATTAFDSDLLVGSIGTVTLPIQNGMSGEISTRDNRGAQVRLSATGGREVSETLAVGTPVRIVAMHGGNAVVAPAED